MAILFLLNNKYENWHKCWKNFFEIHNNKIISELENYLCKYSVSCISYIRLSLSSDLPIGNLVYLKSALSDIRDCLEIFLWAHDKGNDIINIADNNTLLWIEENLLSEK